MNTAQKVIDHYGLLPQSIKAIEEMAELQQELCKFIIGQGDKEHLAEEIADVKFMIRQMELGHRVEKEVADWLQAKEIRTLDIMGRGKND